MNDARKAAAYHAALGAFGSVEAPVGMHDLTGVEIRIRFPQGAAVHRGKGQCGDGYDEYEPAAPSYFIQATRLLLDALGLSGPEAEKAWKKAITKAIGQGESAAKELPAEYTVALDALVAKLPKPPAKKRKTAAKRLGLEDTEIVVVDPQDSAAQAASAPRRKRVPC